MVVWAGAGSKSPFIFNPYASKEEGAGGPTPQGPAEWVCGETASVDIHIQNPTAVTLRVPPSPPLPPAPHQFLLSSVPHTYVASCFFTSVCERMGEHQ